MTPRRLTVRTKLFVVMTGLIAILSLSVSIYVPAKLRREALAAAAAKAESIAAMTAYAVAPALVFDDPTAALESFEGARRNRDLVYVAAYDASGRKLAEWGREPDARAVGSGRFHRIVQPVSHDGRNVGRLSMLFSLDEVHAQIARSRTTVALLSLLVFLLGAIAVAVISTLLTKPLNSIVRASEAIAAGATGRRAEVTTGDEIGHLARSFNAMIDQLESLQRHLEARVEDRTRELRQEIAERRFVEDALRESERRYRLLFERNLAGVYRTTIDGKILDCNDAAARVVGFDSREDLVGASVVTYFHDPGERADLIERLRREKSIPNVEVHMRRRDGKSVWILESMNLIEGEGADIIEGTLIDITARKEAERQVEHQAYHDALTGLPNRSLFMDRLAIVLARARRKQTIAAVMFIDLDRFKYVNDTFGHAAGDNLLKTASGRLRISVREEDTVARLGGDEFTLLLADLGGPDDAVRVAQKMIEVMSQPFLVGTEEVFVTPSIGIALYPADGRDADTLLRNADNAMYRAKEAGRNTYQLYSEAVNKRAAMRLSLETNLRRAIEREEFLVHYQPQVRLDAWEIVGVEAMVRWDHPTLGLLEPAQFIPLAEETKLIIAIDEWVLREACRRAKTWEQAGVYIARIAVNLSASQLHHRDLRRVIRGAIEEAKFDPSRVELEITESTAMHSPEDTIRLLNDLRDLGMRIAIDDFGMGHSALHYLHRFPVDTIKVDKSFVSALGGNPRSGAIVTAIVAMARALGLNVVAEGVETAEQLAFLKQVGCSEIQGFLFSRPVPGNELVDLYKRQAAGALKEPRLFPG